MCHVKTRTLERFISAQSHFLPLIENRLFAMLGVNSCRHRKQEFDKNVCVVRKTKNEM